MKCGHSAQRGNFFPLVKHKANLSLDVIFACKNSARVIQPVARLRETLTGWALGFALLDNGKQGSNLVKPAAEKTKS